MRNLGIDLGNTIVDTKNLGKRDVFPDCIETIHKLHSMFDNIYIISKVNSEQRERSLNWLHDFDFFNKTKIHKDNLYYCFDRRDKAILAKGLGLTNFIDDRPEVLAHMESSIGKILFRPSTSELEKWKGKLINTIVMNDWRDIPRLILIGEVSKVKS